MVTFAIFLLRYLNCARSLPAPPYWSPPRTDVMRSVLKPSQCIRPM